MVMCQALIIWQPVIAKTCKYTMHHYHCTVLGTRFAYSNQHASIGSCIVIFGTRRHEWLQLYYLHTG